MITRNAKIPTAATKISDIGSLLRETERLPISSGLSAPAKPVYPTSSLSTAPTTFPTPNSCTSSFLVVVVPSVTSMS